LTRSLTVSLTRSLTVSFCINRPLAPQGPCLEPRPAVRSAGRSAVILPNRGTGIWSKAVLALLPCARRPIAPLSVVHQCREPCHAVILAQGRRMLERSLCSDSIAEWPPTLECMGSSSQGFREHGCAHHADATSVVANPQIRWPSVGRVSKQCAKWVAHWMHFHVKRSTFVHALVHCGYVVLVSIMVRTQS